MDKDTHGERDYRAAARDFSVSPAQRLARNAVLVAAQFAQRANITSTSSKTQPKIGKMTA